MSSKNSFSNLCIHEGFLRVTAESSNPSILLCDACDIHVTGEPVQGCHIFLFYLMLIRMAASCVLDLHI